MRTLGLPRRSARSLVCRCGYATEAPLPSTFASTSTEPVPNRQQEVPSLASSSSGARAPILNRTGAIDPGLHRELAGIVNSFRAPIRHAFAYGSAVFRQSGYVESDKPMVDFIFAVSEPVQWHSLNMQQNPSHYAILARTLGAHFVSHVQQRYGARAWFNVECEVNGRLIKYGVISMEALCDDLSDWETLYMSGRMQKPIHILRDEPRVRINEEVNLKNAFRTALLLLPERFSEEELYKRITSLSYQGDFRMQMGENPAKVSNIVTAQFPRFHNLYAPFLSSTSPSSSRSALVQRPSASSTDIVQDVSPRARGDLARHLPEKLRNRIFGIYERTENVKRALGGKSGEDLPDADEATLWTQIAQSPDFRDSIVKSLESIVSGPAYYQSLKGIISVGPAKGWRYVWAKVQKRNQQRRQ